MYFIVDRDNFCDTLEGKYDLLAIGMEKGRNVSNWYFIWYIEANNNSTTVYKWIRSPSFSLQRSSIHPHSINCRNKMSEKLGWGSIILFKWNKEWERAAFTSHNRWKNQPRFPSLAPFNGSMEGEKGSQWTSHGASWNFRSNEPFPLCLFRAEKRHPPRRPIPRPTLLLFASWTGRGEGERKKSDPFVIRTPSTGPASVAGSTIVPGTLDSWLRFDTGRSSLRSRFYRPPINRHLVFSSAKFSRWILRDDGSVEKPEMMENANWWTWAELRIEESISCLKNDNT